MQHRSAAIDGELGLAIEDDEHLFGGIMKVMPYASAWHDLAAVHEIEIDIHRGRGNQQHASHIPGTFVGAAMPVLAWVVMADTGCQLRLGRDRGSQKS
jgi:hypothetical protein